MTDIAITDLYKKIGYLLDSIEDQRVIIQDLEKRLRLAEAQLARVQWPTYVPPVQRPNYAEPPYWWGGWRVTSDLEGRTVAPDWNK